MITWSQFARIKFQPVQPHQILPYDYLWKLNFVLERQDSFPPSICLEMYVFSLNFFFCRLVSLRNWKPIDFHCRFKNFLLESSAVSILFHKIRSSRSQIFFKTGVLKSFAIFTGKLKNWFHFLMKSRSAYRPQHRCFPVNIAKFLLFCRAPPVAASVKWWNSTKTFVIFFLTDWRHMRYKCTVEISSIYWNVLLCIFSNWCVN